jgi:hypothetical protein
VAQHHQHTADDPAFQTEAVRLQKVLEDREKRRQEALKREKEQGGGLGGFSSGMSSMKSAVGSMSR